MQLDPVPPYLRPFLSLCVALLPAMTMACGGLPQRHVDISPHTVSKGDEKKAGKILAFSTPADVRLGFVRHPDVQAIYCAEPLPDVSLASNRKGSGSGKASADLAKLGTVGLDASATYELAVTVAELEGRTQTVLLAREFLYRLCEARSNGFFTGEQAYVDLQQNALRMIESIIVRSEGATESSGTQAQALAALITAQQKTCSATKTACTEATNDAQMKQKCSQTEASCLAAIEVPSLHDEDSKGDDKGGTPTTEPAESTWIEAVTAGK